jgi:hypothetical protein
MYETYFVEEQLTLDQLANVPLFNQRKGGYMCGDIVVAHSALDNRLNFSLPTDPDRRYPMGALGRITPEACKQLMKKRRIDIDFKTNLAEDYDDYPYINSNVREALEMLDRLENPLEVVLAVDAEKEQSPGVEFSLKINYPISVPVIFTVKCNYVPTMWLTRENIAVMLSTLMSREVFGDRLAQVVDTIHVMSNTLIGGAIYNSVRRVLTLSIDT